MFSHDEPVEHFIRLTGETKKNIFTRGRNTVARAMVMDLMYRFFKMTQSAIGEIVGGIDYSAVSQALSRLRKRLQENRKLGRKLEAIDRRLRDLSRINGLLPK